MSGFVVVDASLAFKWLVREEHTDKALAILREWHDEEVTPTAPHLLPFEISNALHKRVTRGELSVEGAVDLIGKPAHFPDRVASAVESPRKGVWRWQVDLVKLLPTMPTTWRLLRVSVATCGPQMRSSISLSRKATGACTG